MKKTLIACLLVLCAAAAQALDLTGLDRWVTGFPRGQTTIAGRPITKFVIEKTGVLLSLEANGVLVRLNIIQPLPLEVLEKKYDAVNGTILPAAQLTSEKWKIVIQECDIELGLKDDMTVGLVVSSFRLRLNKETLLELKGKLEANPLFLRAANADAFAFRLRFSGISLSAGGQEAFPGWPAYLQALAAWFERGVQTNNQAVLALIYETKIIVQKDDELKRVVLSKDERSNVWLGLDVEYLMHSILMADVNGFLGRPLEYNVLQVMLGLDVRRLGDKSWLAKPFSFRATLGAFFELNAGSFARYESGEWLWADQTNGSFTMAFGPAVGASFSAMIPRIIDSKYTGDICGVGIELLTAFNLPYLFSGYAYEYFLIQYLNFVVHIIPVDGAGLDACLGFNFTLATVSYDLSMGGIHVDRFGLTAGLRLKIDLYNFFASNTMIE